MITNILRPQTLIWLIPVLVLFIFLLFRDFVHDVFGDEKDKPAADEGPQEIGSFHRRGDETLQQLLHAHIHDDVAHSPKAAAQKIGPQQSGNEEIDIAGTRLLDDLVPG